MSGGGGESRGRDAQDVVCQFGSGKLISGQLAMTVHVCSPGNVETVLCVFLCVFLQAFSRKLTRLNNGLVIYVSFFFWQR